MKPSLSRRDILKLASVLALSPLAGKAPHTISQKRKVFQSVEPHNVIIILLDTLSANHLPIYGYPRETSPNLARFAQKATVYHSHYSAGNYTTPSTASLLTGTYPWTHRALHLSGVVIKELEAKNIFNLIGEKYHRLGFAHNQLANVLLHQFSDHIDQHVKTGTFNLLNNTIYDRYFPNDALAARRSFDKNLFWVHQPGSLYLSQARNLRIIADYNAKNTKWESLYPRGLPGAGDPSLAFALEPLFDGVINLLDAQPAPFFAYIHLFPPHSPYRARKEFNRLFRDGWDPPSKEPHFFTENETESHLSILRSRYDDYIAHTDAELGRLLDHLQMSGLMDNSYVIVTSDHGELFERGMTGHNTRLLYESVIHIPLLISCPEQMERKDVHTLTSNVDLLPTILHLMEHPIPDWCEGQVLPGFCEHVSTERSVYTAEAKTNSAYKPLTKATFALIKDPYKLIHYRGYEGYEDVLELYDLKNDPEELTDLSSIKPSITKELKAELQAKLNASDQPDL